MTSSLRTQIRSKWPFADAPPRRIVLKIGSNVLAKAEGGLQLDRIEGICGSIARARAAGTEVIVVSSGAVAAGRGVLGLEKRPPLLPDLQAVAAIGQAALMETYNQYLRPHGLVGAQMLLNREDMDDRRRYLNARHALLSLLQHPAIPIINENDSVNIDELKFGDNDMLSAIVAAKMEAQLLVIFSNIPGLMTASPCEDPTAQLIPVVKTFGKEIEALAGKSRSGHGTGGMGTKLQAARHATSFGVCAVIVDGMVPGQLDAVLAGDFEGTLFCARGGKRAGSSRKHWLTTHRPKGSVTVDAGAVRALVDKKKSLLPVGIRRVDGPFRKGDIIAIKDPEGAVVAQGMSNYDDETMARIAGKHAGEIGVVLGEAAYDEAVHKNHLVVLAEE